MAYLNKLQLIGRLTADPDAPRTIQGGGSVLTIRFAAGRSRKNAQTGQWENDPNPLFIDCEVWSQPGAKRDLVSLIHANCKKGDQVYLDGWLKLETWDDKNGGGKRSKHKMVIQDIQFLNSKGEQQAAPQQSRQQQQRPAQQPHYGPSPDNDEPIPF